MGGDGCLRDWILEAAGGEPVEAVVIGENDYMDDMIPGYAEHRRNEPLTWAEAEPWLRYTFDDGFGAAGCEPVYAWTSTRVIFVTEYDGATGIMWIPRHPQPCTPAHA